MVDSIAARFRNIFKKSASVAQVSTDEAAADPAQVEPLSLALQIQSLIENLPSPTSTSNSAPYQDDQPPILPAPKQDSNLMAMLRNTTVMNGSSSTNGDRPSIWSVLERLRSSNSKQSRNTVENDSNSGIRPADDDVSDLFSDSSSVMLYSPLLPARGSLVELADSEVTIDVVEEVGEDEEESVDVGGLELLQSQPPIPGWTWANIIPSFDWFTQPAPTAPHGSNATPLTPRTRQRQLRTQASRTWIPSKDQLSIQCLWWGYRMFLPPPVLDILNDRQLEAARRTVMITTALTWFFDNLPIDTLPPALRPTLLLIKHIAPYLAYIGTFISWSWGTMTSYDQGCGITLTATWILPFALIPGTWFERDWPVTPPPLSQSLPGTPSPQTEPATLQSEAQSPTLVYTMTPPPKESSPVQATSPRTPLVPIVSSQLPNSPPSHVAPAFLSPQPDLASLAPSSSPALSFVTAPSSPLPPSPKRNLPSLASLVSKSPLIRVRRIRSKQALNHIPVRSPCHSPSPLSQSHSLLDPEVGHSTYLSPLRMTQPTTISYYSPEAAPSSALHHPSDIYPLPPAHPTDLQLLQSPLWQCSPLPPEHLLHPALSSEVQIQDGSNVIRRKTKNLFSKKRS